MQQLASGGENKKCLSCRHSQPSSTGNQLQQNISAQNINSDLNMIYIKCSECRIVQCKPCFKQHLAQNHHLRQHPTQSNQHEQDSNHTVFEIICQQCQQNDSRKFCQNCQQHLCDKCSFRIHNKGKRAKHNVLSNDILIRIQKLFFLHQNQNEQQFKAHHLQFDPSNCLIVYSPQRPQFIEQFQSLEVENMSKLTIEQIESCLNRYPLISLFSVHQNDTQLANMLTHLIVDSDNQEEQEDDKQAFIFLGGFRIVLQVRRDVNRVHKEGISNIRDNKEKGLLARYGEKDKILIEPLQIMNDNNDSLTTVMKSHTDDGRSQSPQEKKFLKKQSIDFSCGSKQEHQPIIEMNKLFKKSLKMSNRSLIIQIPQTKQYKQSPIKSDREQGFIQRNMKLLQNANKKQQSQNKTITLHLDQNYNDISGSTMNYYQQSSYHKSNNQESILFMGTAMNDNQSSQIIDTSLTSSFRLMTTNENNDTIVSQTSSTSFIQNHNDQSNNNIIGSLSLLHVGNISLSTENSIRKRSRKAPIPYFQPLKSKTIDNLNNSYGYMHGQKLRNRLQRKFRQLAQKGILMVSKKQLQQFNLGYDDKIIRKMKKTVCEEQIQYYSLNLELISIQSLVWILQSIKVDMMTPTQKLILSRLKQSYNLKPAQKLWTYIIKYLQSQQYLNDKMAYDKCKQLPQIIVGRQGDQVLLEYEERWVYEDQECCEEEMTQEWEMFRKFLNEYFKLNKQITGGRYGCVQYVKLNGPQQLRECSLGRLSYFVQQAINKGLIRYHKTLLIQNYQSFEQSLGGNKRKSQQLSSTTQTNIQQLFETQKQLKILKIQLTLIQIFLQAGQQCEISLAQIPLTFKKMILFDVNLLELGYPKLKNMLQTLTDKLVLSSSKSHIKYKEIKSQQKIQQLRQRYTKTVEGFVNQMVRLVQEIISRRGLMMVTELGGLLDERLGFVVDWRVCEVGDVCQFLMYYCQHISELQFISGNFFVCSKGTLATQHNNKNNYHPHNQHYQGQLQHGQHVQHGHHHYDQFSCTHMTQTHNCNYYSLSKHQQLQQQQYYNYCTYTQQQQQCYHPHQHQHQQCANYYLMNENNPNQYQRYQYQNCSYHPQQYSNHHFYQQQYQNNSNNNQLQQQHQQQQYQQKHQQQQYQQYYCTHYNNYQHQHQQQHYNPFYPTTTSNRPLHTRQQQKPQQSQFIPLPSPFQQPTQISTPKFNQSLQYINKKSFNNNQNIKTTIQNFKWQSYLDDMSNFQDHDQKNNHHYQNQSFTDYQSIYNILDDDQHSQAKSKLSFPKTFIQKEGSSCNHNQGELHISKITPIDQRSDRDEECDGSLGLFDQSPQKQVKMNIVEQGLKSGRKGQHTRVYSTTQARTKHQRMYSTTTAKN